MNPLKFLIRLTPFILLIACEKNTVEPEEFPESGTAVLIFNGEEEIFEGASALVVAEEDKPYPTFFNTVSVVHKPDTVYSEYLNRQIWIQHSVEEPGRFNFTEENIVKLSYFNRDVVYGDYHLIPDSNNYLEITEIDLTEDTFKADFELHFSNKDRTHSYFPDTVHITEGKMYGPIIRKVE